MKKLRGNLLLLTAAFIWGFSFVVTSSALESIPPMWYGASRYLLGALVLLPFVIPRFKDDKKIWKTTIEGGLLSGMVLFIGTAFQQYGMLVTAPGKSGFLSSFYLIFTPLISFLFLKKKIGKSVVFAIGLAMVGFYFLCIHGDLSLSINDIFILCCAFFYAIQILIIDHYAKAEVDPVSLTFCQFISSGLLFLLASLILETPTFSVLLEAKWMMLYAGVISSGMAYTFQVIGQRDSDTTSATLLMSLESVFSVLTEWLVLHTVMSIYEYLGCILIFIAVIIVQLPEKENEHDR